MVDGVKFVADKGGRIFFLYRPNNPKPKNNIYTFRFFCKLEGEDLNNQLIIQGIVWAVVPNLYRRT